MVTKPHPRARVLSTCGAIFVLALATLVASFIIHRLPNPKASVSLWFPSQSTLPARLRLRKQSPPRDLLFDPVLFYASFLGGDNYSSGGGGALQSATVIFVDPAGNLYVGGQTNSANFPVTSGVVGTKNSAQNLLGFVSKLDPTGQTLLFSTYVPGISNISAMTVDATGKVYVAGPIFAASSLPIPSGSSPFQAAAKSDNIIGILELNNTATSILSGTYLGGSGSEYVGGLALDSSNDLYITGTTTSNDFPIHNALQSSLGSRSNLFVTVLNSALSTAIYSTYLGQSSVASSGSGPHTVAVDTSKDAYVVGWASPGFPITSGAIQTSCSVAAPAVSSCVTVTKLNPTGSTLLFSTYLGNAEGKGNAVAVDSAQNIYIGGQLYSSGFPELNPVAMFPSCSALLGGGGGFVSEIAAAGTLAFSTCTPSSLNNLALDSSGNLYAAGVSIGAGMLKNPIQSNAAGSSIVAINPSSSSLLFSSFIGGGQQNNNGAESEVLSDVGVDAAGNIYAAGFQPGSGYLFYSGTLLFPVFNAVQPAPGGNVQCPSNPCYGGTSAILLKISPTNAPAAAVSSALLPFPPQQLGMPSTAEAVTVFDMGSASLTVSNVTATGDFSIQNGCSNVGAAGGNCAIQVTFTPTALGTRNGTLIITDNSAGSPHTVQLTGQGAEPTAALSPTSLTFPSQALGTTSAAQTITLNNAGAVALTISSVQTTSSFSESNNCGNSVSPNNSCTINVTFSPTANGPATGTLTIMDSVTGSPHTVALTGTGVADSIGLVYPANNGISSSNTPAGSVALTTIQVGGAGVSGTVSFSCSGLPPGATCSFSPSTVQMKPTGPSQVQLTISTTARSLLFGPIVLTTGLLVLAIWVSFMLLRNTSTTPTPRLRWRFVPLFALAICACGGGSGSSPSGGSGSSTGTPVGSYIVVITAASSSSTQTLNFNLTVK